ncbi:sensor histidine kinase [Enterovibrio sp. 27052020O]|uniref:sensor histidine kinase n=1 Tax=Enterovibrio sp. 27052020O TaxID=3241166 RepID=UPI00388F7E27
MTFKHRLLLFTIVWFLFSAALLTALSVSVWKENEFRAKQILHSELAVHMRDDNPLMVGDDYSTEALSSIFHTLMLLGPDFEIYFLDPEGNITTSGPPIEDVQRRKIDVAPIQQFLDSQPYPILGDDPLSHSGKNVFSAAQIDAGGKVAGYLYVVIGRSENGALLDSESLLLYAPVVFAALVAILLFALCVYRMVFRHIITPGRLMVHQIEQAASSEFRVTPPLKFSTAELQELASQYRRMMAVIQQQFIQLRIQEAQRREHLVQLSHDLKTPLANVLGYLETWRIQHNEGRGMIDTAYHNAQRLQRHLKEQLDAARSPTAKVVLSYQEIDVNALLQEIKQRFALSAKHKLVDIVVSADIQISVIADEQLINRVFDNLLENAIRHSPSHSTILIDAAKASARRVGFRISNSVEKGSASGSLGMGTKIVEAILSLHQSQLERIEEDLTESFSVYFELSSIADKTSSQIRAVPDVFTSVIDSENEPQMTSSLPTVNGGLRETADETRAMPMLMTDDPASAEPLPSFSASDTGPSSGSSDEKNEQADERGRK